MSDPPSDPFNDEDRRFMRLALELAREARDAGEIPVGALVVAGGGILGRGRNASVGLSDPTAHAEVLALRDAGGRVANYRLVGATLYCTVEPCLMCLGAMLHARIGRLVFGAREVKLGASARLEVLRELGAVFNHRFETVEGVEAEESAQLLLDFFRERRGAATAGHSKPTSPESGEVPKWS